MGPVGRSQLQRGSESQSILLLTPETSGRERNLLRPAQDEHAQLNEQTALLNLKCFVFLKTNTPSPAAFLPHDCTEPFPPSGHSRHCHGAALLFRKMQEAPSSRRNCSSWTSPASFAILVSASRTTPNTGQGPLNPVCTWPPLLQTKSRSPGAGHISSTARRHLAGCHLEGAPARHTQDMGAHIHPKYAQSRSFKRCKKGFGDSMQPAELLGRVMQLTQQTEAFKKLLVRLK